MGAITSPQLTRANLMWLFGELSRAHGPSGWWPSLYGGNFEIVCGAILTQHVAWRNVEQALKRMRADRLWSWEALHSAPVERLERAIRPSGFYRAKARKLRIFAAVVLERHGGDLERMLEQDTATLRRELLGIWGVGPETADDIVLYAAGRPKFVIDNYTVRILERLGWGIDGLRDPYAGYQQALERRLERDAGLFQEFHGLLDRHAARVCKARPLCGQCVLSERCGEFRRRRREGRV